MLRRQRGDRSDQDVRRARDRKPAARLMNCSAMRACGTFLRSRSEAPVLAIAVALVCGGCSVLTPKQDHTRFIMLAATTPSAAGGEQSAGSPNLASIAIGLGPVQLPQYLDRPELVIRTSPNGFDLSQTDRWAEPLADNFCHVLANDLTNMLGATNILQYPWYPGSKLDYIVHIEVQRFEADTSRNAQLVARWDLRTQSDQVLATRDMQLSRPLSSLTGDAAAAALSEEVGELTGQIAAAIVQTEQQRLARGPH